MSAGPTAERSEGEVATDLVRRIHGGDPAAEAELVDRYSRGLLFMLRRLTGRAELADDFHQDTFRIVLERLRSRGLDEPAGLAGYLRGTARNLVVADRRKQARRRTDEDAEEIERAVDPNPGQLRSVMLREEAGIIRRLIGELKTDRDRQLLYRFYIAEEDKETICADLGLSSLHFNRVLFRARQRFKELLERSETRRARSA